MAKSVNKVILLGNLTRDCELSYTPGGQAMGKVGLATNRRWNDAGGAVQEETEFHNLVIWNKTAENLSQYLTKGKLVYVEGRIKSRSWERDGVKYHATDIIVDEVNMLTGNEGSGTPPPRASRPVSAPARRVVRPAAPPPEDLNVSPADIDESEIPF
jgi:single-strand DNA-binding protein